MFAKAPSALPTKRTGPENEIRGPTRLVPEGCFEVSHPFKGIPLHLDPMAHPKQETRAPCLLMHKKADDPE